MPLEVMGDIFCILVHIVAEKDYYDVSRQVVKINLVCRAWRNAALATPQIWAGLAVRMIPVPDYKKVARWLARSKGLLRALMIGFDFEGGDIYANPCCDADKQGRPCTLLDPGLIELLTQGPTLERLTIVCNKYQ